MRLTTAEVAGRLGVDREVARGLIHFLVELGLAEFKGERPPETGRGKAQHVFEFVEGFEKQLADTLKKAKLVG